MEMEIDCKTYPQLVHVGLAVPAPEHLHRHTRLVHVPPLAAVLPRVLARPPDGIGLQVVLADRPGRIAQRGELALAEVVLVTPDLEHDHGLRTLLLARDPVDQLVRLALGGVCGFVVWWVWWNGWVFGGGG